MATRDVRVLIVEDTPKLASTIQHTLEREGMHVEIAGEAETALDLARAGQPDIVLLDISLPGIDGIEACRRLRTFSDAYIVMVTGRDSEADRLIGLSSGADDYIVKPFFATELVARIRAMMRRPREIAGVARALTAGPLVVDVDAREARLDGDRVDLSRIEFDLLAVLLANPRISFSRAQMLERVWGPDWFGDDHVVDVHISKLRRKLGDDPNRPRFIRTVRGFGYRSGTGKPEEP